MYSKLNISINSSMTKTNSIVNRQSQPTYDDVLLYFKSNSFIADADVFFEHYESKGWISNNKPVKNWRLLADYWNDNEFVYLPNEIYKNGYSNLPDDIAMLIEKDQSTSKSPRVRNSTLRTINEYLDIRKKDIAK